MDPFDAAALRSAYDKVADDYVLAFGDDLEALPLDRSILDRAAGMLTGSDPLLDLGCGPGQVAGYIAERGVAAVGLDVSTRMLGHAARRTPAATFTCGDMLHLPYRSASLSAVVAFYSIQHLERASLPEAVGEMSRVLGRQGLLVIAAHLGAGETYTEEFLGHRTARIGGTFFTEEELLDVIRNHSFSIHVNRKRQSLPHEYESTRIYVIAQKDDAAGASRREATSSLDPGTR